MRRGKERWTHADDERLSRALLTVFANSGESVVLGDDRALWKRVQQRYQEFTTAEADATAAVPRSARSLHTRWVRGIRPDLILFSSLVHKTGGGTAKAVSQAVRLFREQRSESNALAVRQFVHKRQRTSVTSGGDGDSETDSGRPKLKFESFHFLHCYDILCANPAFLKVLLDQRSSRGGNASPDKRRRTLDGGSALSVRGNCATTAESREETERMSTLRAPRASRGPRATAGSTSSNHMHQPPPPSQSSQRRDLETSHSSNAAPRSSSSVVITLDEVSDGLNVPQVECDRAVANEYVRLRIQTLQEDRRLKLLAELRGVVATMAQLAQQLAWDGVASAALAARTGGACVASTQGVLRDMAFFRHEKQRLKQRIAGLDGPPSTRDRAAPT